MRRASDFLDVVDTTFTQAGASRALYNTLEDYTVEGRFVHLYGKKLVNLGSCGYTGIELDPRVKEGIIDAARRYGAQFPASRAYLQTPLYAEAEELLERIFGAPTLLTASSTYGHLTAFPVFIREDDAVILDQQVHQTVQSAVNHVKLQGTHVEMIRHNRMDLLEERIQALRGKARHIWYLADGVYSMFGDLAPLDELERLLDRYEQFHLYLDDAHGVSCFGKHGRGYVLDRMPIRDRMLVVISLCKGFGASGGGLVFPNEEMKRRARVCGAPMTFSGPVQPPMLGSILAAARIHLSDEIRERQNDLREKMELCNRLLTEYDLPSVDPSIAPIRYVGLGLPRVAFNMVNRLMEEGFYANTGLFPAVPMKRGGVRFTLTHYQTKEDLEQFIRAMARHLPAVLEEEGTSLEEIKSSFRRALPEAFLERKFEQRKVVPKASPLTLQHETTISAIKQEEWDRLLGDRGTFTWEGLRFLEETFKDNPEPENNWNFHYYLVRSESGSVVLATFFTDAIWKDDMISPVNTSRIVEQRRAHDPYYLTSRTLSMGSLLSEGNHLYLDRQGPWKEAMKMLLAAVDAERERSQATKIALRDLPSEDKEMDEFLLEQGFVKFRMPESFVLDIDWQDEAEYLASLTKKARQHQRREIHPWRAAYTFEYLNSVSEALSEAEFAHLYELYLAVQSRGLLMNSFPLPRKIIQEVLRHPGWEIMRVTLKPEFGGPPEGTPVGFLVSYLKGEQFVPLFVGLDYAFVESHRAYRIILDSCVRLAVAKGAKRILLGFGAPVEKLRFGAKARVNCLYAQSFDHFNDDVLAQITIDTPTWPA